MLPNRVDDPLAHRYPPNLVSFAWSPPWGPKAMRRNICTHTIPKHPDMRQFAETALSTVRTLKEVMYQTPQGAWCRHAVVDDGSRTFSDAWMFDEEDWENVV